MTSRDLALDCSYRPNAHAGIATSLLQCCNADAALRNAAQNVCACVYRADTGLLHSFPNAHKLVITGILSESACEMEGFLDAMDKDLSVLDTWWWWTRACA